MTSDILKEILHYINQHRTQKEHFDVVIGGETPSDDPVKQVEIISPLIEVGMTWWLEDINEQRGSFEEMRRRIKQGPPKATPMEE